MIAGRRSSGDDYSYSIDLTANSLLTRGDLYTIGFRYINSKVNTTSFSINTRFPVTREFRINPRFRFDLRDNNGTTRWTYRPSVRLSYRMFRSLQFEAEAGAEWQKSELPSNVSGDLDRVKGYFFIVGYRLDF
ncbi:MAG: hypothetical protein ACKE51_08655 [Methylococcaceae bacterium]